MTPEGKIKAKVKKQLREKLPPQLWSFMPVQMGLGAPALDFLICANGWFVAIETKVKGKKPTARQELTMQAIRNAGGLVFVVDDDVSLALCVNYVLVKCFGLTDGDGGTAA